MSSRCGKWRRRGNPPIPMWLPQPRPCLRSLNAPQPYYMPVPEMYFPPWAVPPSYLARPLCHCANDNYCTASTCRDSTECQRLGPVYCPHGIKGGNANTKSTIYEEAEDDHQPSRSASDICPSCGAYTSGKRIPEYVPQQPYFESSSSTSQIVRQTKNGIETTEKNIFQIKDNANIIEQRSATGVVNDFIDERNGSKLPETLPQQLSNRCNNSSCQTQIGGLINSPTPRRNISLRRVGGPSATSFEPVTRPSLPIPSDGKNYSSRTDFTSKRLASTTNLKPSGPSTFDSDQSPNIRKEKLTSKSRCCMTTLDSISGCHKSAMDSIPIESNRKKSSKLSFETRKPTSSECSSKRSTCECFSSSPRKSPRKKAKERKRTNQSDAAVENKETEIARPLVSHQRGPECQCRFPPAYKHLICSGSKNGNCSCANQ